MVLIVLLATSAMGFAATPTLDRISCVTTTYNSPGTDTCRVFLTGVTTSHVYIALNSSNPAVKIPSEITVSLNASSKGFAASIGSVTKPQTATITAFDGPAVKTFTIYLSPTTSSSGTGSSGSGSAALSVNAASIGFGSVMLNTPVEQALTLTSSGSSAVTVNSATISGAGFSISNAAFPVTLNPGQSTTLNVQFDPTSTGSFTGQLAISSSVSAKTLALTGTGVSHEVNLSWNPSSAASDPAVGYNVYRAPAGTTSFSRVNGSLATQTAYTDKAVQSGATYDYVVTSVDAKGSESSPSNATRAIVP